jgi:hypothetical protein
LSGDGSLQAERRERLTTETVHRKIAGVELEVVGVVVDGERRSGLAGQMVVE